MQFPNQRTLCRQTIMDNYNKYVQYGLSLNRNAGNSARPRTARTQANIDVVRRALEAHPLTRTQILTINIRSSTENCGLVCAPAILAQFFCFQFPSSAQVLGFTHRKALEQLQNTWLCSTVIIPLLYWYTVKKKKKKILALSIENGPGYFTPTFSITHNFCSRLSI